MGLPVKWDTCIDIKKIKLDRNRFLKGGNRAQVTVTICFLMSHATQTTRFAHATLFYVCDCFFVGVHATQNMNSARAIFDDALTRSYSRPPTHTRAMAAGPPRCPCGKHLLAQLKTIDMRDRWADHEGISWSQHRGYAFFHFCHECHNSHWPADVRRARGNRHTRPRDADPMAGSSKRKANVEFFYLTAPAPEFFSDTISTHAFSLGFQRLTAVNVG